ncbi:sodium/proton antiporter, CPA1 family [Cohaesibacter marisflavi]|uniref:Sodium/proton antiporter, CPA1 family n=1 Tax=Cohaesibacter marisflavi TaxID=655353 RepID=A0A1I5NBT3_9HYPH|nr:cation:proton antiporter [Cohaesibacter marisflavi]SFP19152.1 sodium/proton antiporter, CPA1 family [Cohaesibacter marisflavi]
MDFSILIAVSVSIFFVIGVSEPLAARLRLPYSVILAGMGIAIGVGAAFLWQTDLTDALNPFALTILTLPVRSSVFLTALLPLLVFQVALNIDIRRMLDDWVPILILAIVAVVVAMLAVGFLLNFFVTDLSLAACLLIGAIVSTTDPSAVVSIFKGTSSPQRLARIVEGESLLNDAAAIAFFSLFLAFVTLNENNPDIGEALLGFPWIIAGGAAAGFVLGWIAVWIIARMAVYPKGQISVSLAVPSLTYLLAEQISASGVIGVVAAGLTINLHMTSKFTPSFNKQLRDTWELLSHWAGSLIFILAAIFIPRLLSNFIPFDIVLIGVVVIAALAARAVILFGLLPLLAVVKLSPRIEPRYCGAILWGGLRGAVTLALALAVTENRFIPDEVKHQVGILATGFTLFTLIVQGTTLRWAITKLGLDRLSSLDVALSNQVIAVALQTVRERVAETARSLELTHEIVRDEAKSFAERLDQAVISAEKVTQISDRDRITLGLVALAAHERDTILEAYKEQIISADLAERLLLEADYIIEATHTKGRSGYRDAARRAYRVGPKFRVAMLLHNYFGITRPLAQLIETRFDILVSLGLVLPRLNQFIDDKIRRIHGRRVAELLHEFLTRRVDETTQELEILRLQFPGYAEGLERRLIRRTTLQLEKREYDALSEDGLIGLELQTDLNVQIEKRRLRLIERPILDLKQQRTKIINDFPAFAELGEKQRKALARGLKMIYAVPGQKLVRRELSGKDVWFVAAGIVILAFDGRKIRLGRGEMFGQLPALARKKLAIKVSAVGYCILFSLNTKRLMKLVKSEEAIRDAVLLSCEKTGIKLTETDLELNEERLAVKVRGLMAGLPASNKSR